MNSQLKSLLDQSARYIEEGDLPNAQAALEHALMMAPRSPDVLGLLGVVAFRQGNVAESVRLLQKTVKARPGDAMGYYNLANVLMGAGEFARALEYLERAVRISPGGYWIRINHGICLAKLRKFEQARDSLTAAIDIDPAEPAGWHNLALCLEEDGRYEDALRAYDRAIQRRLEYAEAWSGKGSVLHRLGRLDEALAHFDKAVELDPRSAQAWANKGGALHDLRRHAEALGCFDRAIEVDPEHPDSYWNKSMTQLRMGDFERGWPNYAYRWKMRDAVPYLHPELPELDSVEGVAGKKILVWSEQGVGDTLQFSRYVVHLVAMGAQVVFEVPESLCALFKDQFGCRIVPRGASVGPLDCQVPLLKLPLLLHTRADAIPADVPYVRVSPECMARWKHVVDRTSGRLTVGVACSGNPAQQNNVRRSAPLAEFQPLFEAVDCYVLQKDLQERDRRYLQANPGIRFLGDEIASFEDTAALVANLDLVVSVDTSLAHLAGAMGRPVFVLLSWAPDWRWMLDRSDSPWYPTARLVRQPAPGDWASVMAEVAGELKRRQGL